MNDQKQKLGVSGFLPPVASACLVRAAADARRVAWDNSLRRAKIIDAAIRKVKLEYPRYFRAPNDCRKLFKNPCSQAELNKIVPFGFSLQRQKMVFFCH